MKFIKKAILASVLAGACNMVQASENYGNPAISMLDLGQCIKAEQDKNYQKAINFCLDSAKSGNRYAQHKLIRLYLDTSNISQSLKWAKKLSEEGDAVGKFALGTFYFHGSGVKKDLKQAKTLWTQACQGGYQHSCDLLKEKF